MSTSWIDFGVVKEQANFPAILARYDITHSSSRRQVSVLCPFHNDTRPSLSVNMEGKWFHCFGCGAKGDILAFVAKLEKVSFPEAAKIIAGCCGISMNSETPSSNRPTKSVIRHPTHDGASCPKREGGLSSGSGGWEGGAWRLPP